MGWLGNREIKIFGKPKGFVMTFMETGSSLEDPVILQ